MYQFHADPRAVAAGLMLPQEHPEEEPRLTDAGLVALLGAMAHCEDEDRETRQRIFHDLMRVLIIAKKGGMEEMAENCLLLLFAAGVSPIDPTDKGKLLALLCRLVSLSVGDGRIASIIQGANTH